MGSPARRRGADWTGSVRPSCAATAPAFGACFARQFRSFLLLLLRSAAVISAAVGETTEAGIILTIVGLSVGLGFVNEFRSEKAVEALHSQIRRTALVERDGRAHQVDVVELVPGDVVRLRVGDIVPADLRLLETSGLECDESVLTGESAAGFFRAQKPPKGGPPSDGLMRSSPLNSSDQPETFRLTELHPLHRLQSRVDRGFVELGTRTHLCDNWLEG
jgi:E1-E2 ATPase